MENPICISTGCVYRLSEDMNEKIRLLRQFSADGIELNFASPINLVFFEPTPNNSESLKNKRTTLHAPWVDIVYGDNPVCVGALHSIQRLYDETHAVLVTLHKKPGEDLSILKGYNFFSAIENDDWRKTFTSVKQVREILEQNSGLGFTFDFAHSLSVSPELTEEYLASMREKMTQAHVSYLDKQTGRHAFLHQHTDKSVEGLLRLIPASVPLVLEAVVPDEANLHSIKEEIDYLKKV